MSLRKISDLPGISRGNTEYRQDRFKKSLLELSYYIDQMENGQPVVTYNSRYMIVENFIYEISDIMGIQKMKDDILCLSIDLSCLSGQVMELSGQVVEISSKVETISVDVNALCANTYNIYNFLGSSLYPYLQGVDTAIKIITENSPVPERPFPQFNIAWQPLPPWDPEH